MCPTRPSWPWPSSQLTPSPCSTISKSPRHLSLAAPSAATSCSSSGAKSRSACRRSRSSAPRRTRCPGQSRQARLRHRPGPLRRDCRLLRCGGTSFHRRFRPRSASGDPCPVARPHDLVPASRRGSRGWPRRAAGLPAHRAHHGRAGARHRRRGRLRSGTRRNGSLPCRPGGCEFHLLPDAGHFAAYEQPQKVASLLAEWLRQSEI